MGDIKNTLWQEITDGMAKAFVWLCYIIIGIMGKLAFESRANKLSRKQIIVKTALSIFAGAIAAIICENTKTQWGKVIVPVATLLGEGIVVYLMTHWKKIAAKFFTGWFDKEK